MKLATYMHQGETKFGAKCQEHLVDLKAVLALSGALSGKSAQSLSEFLSLGSAALTEAASVLADLSAADLAEHSYSLDAVKFLPPVVRPGKIICLGMNYRAHVQEMGRELPKYPTLFAKFANTLVGHKQPIVLPAISQMVDYEAELALVIGKTAKGLAPEQVFDHIAGYTIFNDVSVRDFQNRTLQWLQGKSFDGTGPCGPFLVTKDEVPDPDNLSIELRLNGKTMQKANTSDFIFDIRSTVSYISQIMTLEPGDMISTGTPSGVGAARDPKVFLKAGDMVQIDIASLGVLENPVLAPDKKPESVG